MGKTNQGLSHWKHDLLSKGNKISFTYTIVSATIFSS